jgi:hypothetical protein
MGKWGLQGAINRDADRFNAIEWQVAAPLVIGETTSIRWIIFCATTGWTTRLSSSVEPTFWLVNYCSSRTLAIHRAQHGGKCFGR